MGSLGYEPNIFDTLPGAFPTDTIPEIFDVDEAVTSVVSQLHSLNTNVLLEDSVWRDSYAFTGTFRTFYTSATISKVWKLLASSHAPRDFKVIPKTQNVIRLSKDIGWLETKYEFSTSYPEAKCSGSLSLVLTGDGTWKIWVIRTVLEELTGLGDVDSLEPGPNQALQDTSDFDAIVIGGSQSGLSTGGRLKALGVNYVVIEKNAHVGDAWGLRYESARLHTIREYAHLPFDRTFGPEYGEYVGKTALGEGHRKWAEKYGVNVWLSTKVESGIWNATKRSYTLKITRNGETSEIRAKHVVMATGAGSETPKIPFFAEREKYKGSILHSSNYIDATQWKGKSGIVVGSANTGHDVADDMYQAGLSPVTMIQRSRTYVLPVEYIESRYKVIYNQNIPTEMSDRGMFSGPTSISRLLSLRTFTAMAKAQPERWNALEEAGFKVDPYGDIQEAINIRLGGHYIDVGTSAKISRGLIKVKSDSPVVRYYEKGLVFADGTEVEADVIVLATGFIGNLKQHVAQIFGNEVAADAGDFFGLDSEGEVRNAFKPTGQPGLWYIGGALGHARYCSRFIALSIKADVAGLSLPVYRKHRLNELDYG